MKSRDMCVFWMIALAAVCAGRSWANDAGFLLGTSRILVSSALDLRHALENPAISEVLVDRTIVISASEWGPTVTVHAQNLTVRAADELLAEARYATINFGKSVMLFSLAPGAVMTWIGIDVFFAQATLGATFRPLRQSPGAVLVFSKCIIHRRVGLPYEAGLASAASTERAAAFPRTGPPPQVVGGVSNMTWPVTGGAGGGLRQSSLYMARTTALYDFAADVALDSSLASQGFYFGGYTVVANGPSYDVVDKEVDSACLAARAAIDCLTILLNQVEADSASEAAAAAAAGGSPATSNTTVLVVAVVVPVGVLLLAALIAVSVWWARRRQQAQGLQGTRQPSKATAATAAAAAVASGGAGGGGGASDSQPAAAKQGDSAGSRGKASGAAASDGDSGGLRLGVITGGVQRGDGGGVFAGVESDKDLPPWSAEALRETDDIGDARDAPHRGLTGTLASGGLMNIGSQQSTDGRTTFGAPASGVGGGAMSNDKLNTGGIHLLLSFAGSQRQQLLQHGGPAGVPPARTACGGATRSPAVAPGPTRPVECSAHECHDPPQQQHAPSGELPAAEVPRRVLLVDSAAGAAAAGGGAARAVDASSDRGASTSGMCAGTGSSQSATATPAAAPAAATTDAPAPATDAPAPAAAAGGLRVKPCDRIPSPDEVLAELGALVKEHRTQMNEVPFTLEAVLGHGSFGTVYMGTWQGLPVAIKTVVFSATQESRRNALKEAALCHSIIHPNVIATYATDLQPIGVLPSSGSDTLSHYSTTTRGSSSSRLHQITDWRLYIIQEFADGGPLGNLYGHPALWLGPGVVNLAAVVPLALGIARALAHLHSKRIVHGDLNPNNILLKRDPAEPSGFAAKVGDFGLSVMLPQGRTHISNLRMGTMFYICPGVVCQGKVGPPSDVFSLGVLLWELFHGRRAGVLTKEGPRYCTNFPAFPPSVPEGYKAATLQCLQRQPHNRPSASTVVATLEQLVLTLGSAGYPQQAAGAAAAAGPATAGFGDCAV